jgi:hypothetical protein
MVSANHFDLLIGLSRRCFQASSIHGITNFQSCSAKALLEEE